MSWISLSSPASLPKGSEVWSSGSQTAETGESPPLRRARANRPKEGASLKLALPMRE